MGDVRKTHAYRQLAEWLRAQRLPCHLCGYEIDYSVTGRSVNKHPWSFVMDHVVPISRGGDPLSKDNVRAAHRWCNGSKGNRAGIKRRTNSRRW